MRKFNLSLDDFSPHPNAGLNFESIKWCDKLIEIYPDLKINLFVPSSYRRINGPTYHLTSNKEWTNKVDALWKGNYRVNFHGLHHSRQLWPRKQTEHISNNDEWEYISYGEAKQLIERMVAEFKAVGLSHVHTFRPPGWKVSTGAVKALIESGFKIAGNAEYYRICGKKIKDLNKHWVSYNWDLTGPCTVTHDDIVAYGHTSDWTNNYMNEERYNLIKDYLDSEEHEFRWIEEY